MSAERTMRVVRDHHARSVSVPALPVIELVQQRGATDDAPTVDGATEQLEQLRRDAAARGYDDGYRAGCNAGQRQVHDAAGALLAQLDAAVQERASAQQQSFDALTGNVAAFVFDVLTALVGRELELAAAPARDAIARALRLAPARTTAAVRVHPSDLGTLGDLDDLTAGRAIELVADASVEPGGCIVHAGDCEIDAQLAPALERVREVLAQ